MTTSIKIEQAQERFHELHGKIMGEISSMLRRAKLTSIMHLADEKPTFAATAAELEHFSEVVATLAPMIGLDKSSKDLKPYISAVKNLGDAIDNGCSESLGAAIAELDEMPYI